MNEPLTGQRSVTRA